MQHPLFPLKPITPLFLFRELKKQNDLPVDVSIFVGTLAEYWDNAQNSIKTDHSEHLKGVLQRFGMQLSHWNVFKFYITLLLLDSLSLQNIAWLQELIPKQIQWENRTAKDDTSESAILLQKAQQDAYSKLLEQSLTTAIQKIGYRRSEIVNTPPDPQIFVGIALVAITALTIYGIVAIFQKFSSMDVECENSHLQNFNNYTQAATDLCAEYLGQFCHEPPPPPPGPKIDTSCVPYDDCKALRDVDTQACCVDDTRHDECVGELAGIMLNLNNICSAYFSCSQTGMALVYSCILAAGGITCCIFPSLVAHGNQSSTTTITITEDPAPAIEALLAKSSKATQWFNEHKESLSPADLQTFYAVLVLLQYTNEETISLRATIAPEALPSLFQRVIAPINNSIFSFQRSIGDLGYQRIAAPTAGSASFSINL